MSIDEIKIFLSYVGAFGVGGIIVGGIVLYLLKSFVPSYLREKGKNLATSEDIAKITAEIEGVKLQYAVLLQRRSRIHERQVAILSKLYKCLLEAQDYSKLMTKRVIFTGEKPDEYPQLLHDAVTNAYKEFTIGRLLLPGDVVEEVSTFFQKMYEGQVQLTMAKHPMVTDGQERAQFWERSGTIAYQEIPALLRTIEDKARDIIHGKQDA